MPEFSRPTVPDLIARVQSDLEGALAGVSARLRRRFERAAAVAIALVSNDLHGHIAWNADQIVPGPKMAERFLLRWAALFGLERTAAVRATGSITATGTGGDMPAGTRWRYRPTGALYETLADADDITSEPVAVRAIVGGVAGNVDAGEELELVNQIPDVSGTAVVIGDDGIELGTDIESLPALLERLILRIQEPPKGGAPGDFVTWALEVAGVTRAWEYVGVDGTGNPGIGKVALAFVRDGDENILPDEDAVDAVQAYLLDRFFGDEIIVFAPTGAPLELEIALSPNTGPVQTAVLAEIADMLLRDAEPGGTIRLSRINEAISAATGELDHVLVSPTADVEHDFGVMAVFDNDPPVIVFSDL